VTTPSAARPVVHTSGPDPAHAHPWRAVAVLTVTNLLPLVLVVQGSLDLPLLVVCYVVEAVLVTLSTRAREGRFATLRSRALFATGLVLFAGAPLVAVDWDATTWAALAGTVLLFVAGLRTAERQAGPGEQSWIGTYCWHLCVVFVGSVIAVPYMEDLSVLHQAGWQPAPLGDFPISGLALGLNRAIVESEVAPEVLGTAIFVLFKTVNEVTMAARRAYRSTR